MKTLSSRCSLSYLFIFFLFFLFMNHHQYTYQEEIGEMKAQLTVLWNGDTFIDTTNGMIIRTNP